MSYLEGKTLLNRYFLRQFVDSGGMADIYLAWDKMRSTKMAVKVLRKDSERADRLYHSFTSEAKVLSELEHPNIVRLYEFGQDGGIYFIVMDWVEGSNLKQAVTNREEPFSLGEISTVLIPVCNALHYAHQRGVYHCDIKPANILLHVDKRILLSDFGVASLQSDTRVAGTPPYMAPEQFRGVAPDARTDVYGLGITLFEILSGGHLPFRGDTPHSAGTTARKRIEWEHKHLNLPSISLFNQDIPPEIETVVSKALNKTPRYRYATVMELRDAFEIARAGVAGDGHESRDAIESTVIHGYARRQETPKTLPEKSPYPLVTAVDSAVGPHLVGLSGELAGKAVQIPTKGLTIGRSNTNQMQLGDRSVSRFHATLIHTRRGFSVRDEGSSVGTFVNDQRVTGPMRLKEGDVIRFGFTLKFEFRKR
jgi:serine/threonine-protein kinase